MGVVFLPEINSMLEMSIYNQLKIEVGDHLLYELLLLVDISSSPALESACRLGGRARPLFDFFSSRKSFHFR